nr:hypothetical protein [Rhizobium leguminosarum]
MPCWSVRAVRASPYHDDGSFHDGGSHHDDGRLDPADTISIELTARDESCTSEVDLMRKYPELDGADA